MNAETSSSSNILPAAHQFVADFYHEHVDDRFLFHNFQHALDVLEATRRLSTGVPVGHQEAELLELTALFHDTGYDQGAAGHEDRSKNYARAFLEQQQYPEELIQTVERLIEATKVDHEPQDLLEMLIRDADYSHLGTELYWDRCSRVRQELLMTRKNFMPEEDWVQFELEFITNHQYHTEVARQLYYAGKQKNIKQLRKYQHRMQPGEEALVIQKKKKKKKEKSLVELKQINLGRGVETMFRTTYRTHVNLSSIADNKANIMLSINAIIISIVVSSLVPKFGDFPRLIIPTFILLVVCLTALVFAILSTRPKVTKGEVTPEDIAEKRANLLFFGNFYNMNVEEFHFGMMEMIKDSDFLYSAMTRDLYYLGKVLALKYRYLRICYGVFMYGLVLAVLSFAIVYLLP
ncbi:MAG: HD domain-containing protein [Lewinellaceae bacterium]|nr:HD domain-containing protein [Lewinellaceae bacterium]